MKKILRKLLNLAGSGGDSDGLDYFAKGLYKEMLDNVFEIISGCSFFGLIMVCFSNGLNYKQTWDVFLKIPFDFWMRWGDEILKDRKKLFKLKTIKMFFVIRFKWYPKIKKLASQFTWEVMREKKKVKIMSFCVSFTDDIAKACGLKKNFSIFDLLAVMTKYNYRLRKKMPPIFLTNIGIYKYSFKSKKVYKISNTIIPIDKCLRGTFNNPFLPKEFIKYECIKTGKIVKKRIMDGGLINNHANLFFTGEFKKDFYQVTCNKEPEKKPKKKTYNNVNYNLNRPARNRVFEFIGDDPDNWFLAFHDKNVNLHFGKNKKSNIFLGV